MGKKEKLKDSSDLSILKSMIKKLLKQKEPIRVQPFVPVDMIIDGNEKGWVHTHNMYELFDLPDLEIRGVAPSFLMSSAGMLLNQVAQYMVDSLNGLNGAKPIKAGENFGDPYTQVQIIESPPFHGLDKEGMKSHFSTPRWQLIEIDMVCDFCQAMKAEGKQPKHEH